MMTVTMALDSEEEAQDLMLHHLRIAAMFFEGTPAKLKLPEEVEDEFPSPAFVAFCDAMEKLYPEDE